jgi:predicted ATPase/class 3 adenylate cyclase
MVEAQTALPSGIVTFVFTDIEDSTPLMRRLGDRYPEVLERHFALMEDAWARRDAHDLGRAGDSVLLAFADERDAVDFCADAQQRLDAEPWPEDGRVRVRMGVHCGLAAPRGDGYVALAVHQAARVMAAAHGGQVIVSGPAADRLAGAGHPVDLVALGRYRVRDFEEPLRLYALRGAGLEGEGAGVRAVPAEGHNLVAPATPLHGREEEVAELVALAGPDARVGLVTLVGPGGVGKTRLVTEVGLRVAPRWPDGVWLVDVSPLHDGAQLASAIAAAVGAPASGRDRWDDVLEHLRSRRLLVILDTSERLQTASGDAARRLLATGIGCGVLATGREPLGLEGEQIWQVQPLLVDGADGGSPAMDLLVERARAARRDFRVDGTVLPVLADICRRLDGLPLALELAAARLAVMAPADVLEGLQDRFRFLWTHHAWLPERQRTMRGLLEWSERLLGEREAVAFRRLGVFGGAFGLEAAEAAVADDEIDAYAVPELVWSLVDKSLVVADLTAGTKYRLLESVRAYALERLADTDEAAEVGARTAAWFLERLGPTRRHVPGWKGSVAVEIDNLRALVPLAAASDPERAQELACTIGRYLDASQSYREGIAELSRYVDDIPDATPARIALLTTLGDLYLRVADVEAARHLVDDAAALLATVGALPPWDDVAVERTRGDLACRVGEYGTAVAAARQALGGDLSLRGRARMWSQLGIASLGLGELDAAWDAFEHEADAYRALGDELFQAFAEGNLAEIALRRGDVAGAAGHQHECLTLALALGAPVMVAFSLIVAARIAADGEEWETAATLHAKAEAVLESTGLALYDEDRRLSDEMLAAARDRLGEAAFAAAADDGRALELVAAAASAARVLEQAVGG